MGERDDARRSIEDARERMSAIAEELARRASPGFMKDRAREVAVRKTSEYRERAVSSPGTWSVLGGVLGATAGAVAGKRFREKRESSEAAGRFEPPVKTYEYGYASPSGYNPDTSPYGAAPVSGVEEYGVGVAGAGSWEGRAGEPSGPSRGERMKARAGEAKERASEFRHRASERASEFRHRASDMAENLRERSHRVRERLPEARGRAMGAYREQVNNRPWYLALGAIGLGFLASLLVPVTRKEHELAAPTKGKMRERIQTMEGELESRIGGDSGSRPSSGYQASSISESSSGYDASSPSPSTAPFYGEDAGVVDEGPEGSTSYESPGEGGSRTLH
jgi:ElaB/YqjD/DUF883 family membrane-anchored ribosome-binding protein